MSRRYSTYHPSATVTDDQLLAMLYGPDRARQEHRSMPGCTAVCCAPGSVEEAESALARGIRNALLIEGFALVLLAAGMVIWRMW